MPHLPAGGEIVLFDRSWHNRSGVERVMGFATEEQVAQFFHMSPTEDGTNRHPVCKFSQIAEEFLPVQAGD